MALTQEDIDGLASMTRLSLAPEERERMRGQLEAILEYVHRLAEIDTSDVPEQEVTDVVFSGRADARMTDDPRVRELILQNFPESVGGALKVPAVFENPKG